jgi:hypothetical protein
MPGLGQRSATRESGGLVEAKQMVADQGLLVLPSDFPSDAP